MDLSAIANPYDFSHPVSDPELFIGRTKERGEIGYYLDQAGKTRRPVSLAIMGDRAAGKTSLLNIIEAESGVKKLFPVRVDLDETDIPDELRFFHKILNAIITRAFEADYFGGKSGTAYAVYLDMISAYIVPPSLEFAPWTFPIQYARAKANNRVGVALDDPSFKEDLKRLSAEISRTIVLIFDECNVFRRDHVLLQKIRNIFMNLPGYMLVFSGTKELFPIMDEVFSPIVRQFKKIEIGAFTRFGDTHACVYTPLQRANIPPKIIDKLLSSGEIISDIHKLSGGRPYEIQLICHMLMRRCQMGQSKKFLLNINVLEEIRSELATGQNITERRIIGAARGLQKNSLEALGTLCSSEERIKFDHIWGVEWTVRGETRWTRAALSEQKSLLLSLGIIDEAEGYIKFAGDQFDRIYLKYVARQKQVTFTIWNLSSEVMFWHRLERVLALRWKGLQLLGKINPTNTFEDTTATLRTFSSGEIDETFFSSQISEELTTTLIGPSVVERYILIDGRISVDQQQSQCWFLWPLGKGEKLSKLIAELQEMCDRARVIQWSLVFQHFEISRPVEIELARKIKGLGNEVFNARMAASVGQYLLTAYVDSRNRELAQIYVDTILVLAEQPRAGDTNNIGYVALSRGDYDLAEQFLRQALRSNDDFDRMLSLYNLGVCLALGGKFEEAIDWFEQAAGETWEEAGGIGCIFTLAEDGGKLTTEEIFHIPDLRPHISPAIGACTRMLSAGAAVDAS
jgi:tetratricopeptide (TPR) repeat protein